MEIILAEGLEVCQPGILAVNRFGERGLGLQDGIALLEGELPKL
jgi:hypothetical protein